MRDEDEARERLVQTERALQESEEKYRSLIEDVIDRSAVGIFILALSLDRGWVLEQLLEQIADPHGNPLRRRQRDVGGRRDRARHPPARL